LGGFTSKLEPKIKKAEAAPTPPDIRPESRAWEPSLLQGVCNMEWKTLLIASSAFGLYVICPRMSAMMVQQAKMKGLNLYAIIVLGALISIPLFVMLSRILGCRAPAWSHRPQDGSGVGDNHGVRISWDQASSSDIEFHFLAEGGKLDE
jgi:hypothetical protein